MVGATFGILLNQALKLGLEAEFHRGVLAQDFKLLVELKSALEGFVSGYGFSHIVRAKTTLSS